MRPAAPRPFRAWLVAMAAAWAGICHAATRTDVPGKATGPTNSPQATAPGRARLPIPMPAPSGGASNGPVVLKAERQRPVEVPDPWRHAILGGWTAAGLGLAALAAMWWKRRPGAAQPVEPPPDASVVARARILGARNGMGDARWYVGEVSDAVRGYLEGRFGLRAPEQTTEEFLVSLGGKGLPGMDDGDGLGGFLQQCDLVKFAGWRPEASRLEVLEEEALDLVERTTPVPSMGMGGKAK